MDRHAPTPPVGTTDQEIERAIAAAVANAAFDGIVIEADEQNLIRRSQRGRSPTRSPSGWPSNSPSPRPTPCTSGGATMPDTGVTPRSEPADSAPRIAAWRPPDRRHDCAAERPGADRPGCPDHLCAQAKAMPSVILDGSWLKLFRRTPQPRPARSPVAGEGSA